MKWSESLSVVSDSLRPHGLYIPWNSPGQNTGVGSLSLLQGIFPTQRLIPGLLHCRWILYQLSHKGSLKMLEWVAYPFSSWSSQPRNWTRVSCIAGRFFTKWAIREAHISRGMGNSIQWVSPYVPGTIRWGDSDTEGRNCLGWGPGTDKTQNKEEWKRGTWLHWQSNLKPHGKVIMKLNSGDEKVVMEEDKFALNLEGWVGIHYTEQWDKGIADWGAHMEAWKCLSTVQDTVGIIWVNLG